MDFQKKRHAWVHRAYSAYTIFEMLVAEVLSLPISPVISGSDVKAVSESIIIFERN